MRQGQRRLRGGAEYIPLHGRRGSFVLQHTGTMTRGTPALSVSVVPDSGSGELTGLSGDFNIIVADGKHSYEFNYSLA